MILIALLFVFLVLQSLALTIDRDLSNNQTSKPYSELVYVDKSRISNWIDNGSKAPMDGSIFLFNNSNSALLGIKLFEDPATCLHEANILKILAPLEQIPTIRVNLCEFFDSIQFKATDAMLGDPLPTSSSMNYAEAWNATFEIIQQMAAMGVYYNNFYQNNRQSVLKKNDFFGIIDFAHSIYLDFDDENSLMASELFTGNGTGGSCEYAYASPNRFALCKLINERYKNNAANIQLDKTFLKRLLFEMDAYELQTLLLQNRINYFPSNQYWKQWADAAKNETAYYHSDRRQQFLIYQMNE